MDKRRDAIVEALACKAAALEFAAGEDGRNNEELARAWAALQQWADVGEARFAKLSLEMLRRGSAPGAGSKASSPRRGLLLKTLGELLPGAPAKLSAGNNPFQLSLSHEQVLLLRVAVLEELGWAHWAAYHRAWHAAAAPPAYALF